MNSRTLHSTLLIYAHGYQKGLIMSDLEMSAWKHSWCNADDIKSVLAFTQRMHIHFSRKDIKRIIFLAKQIIGEDYDGPVLPVLNEWED